MMENISLNILVVDTGLCEWKGHRRLRDPTAGS